LRAKIASCTMHLCTAQKHIKLAIKKTNKRNRLKGDMCTVLLKLRNNQLSPQNAKLKTENAIL